jgi:hypothetical protein
MRKSYESVIHKFKIHYKSVIHKFKIQTDLL